MARLFAAWLWVGLALAGCGSSAPTPFASALGATAVPSFTIPVSIDPIGAKRDPETTARLLADPRTAEQGVLSVLSNLAIGVHSPTGRTVLAGSERSASDFWIYDFDVPILARMAGDTPQPFDELTRIMTGAGFKGTGADLAATYAAAYGAHPDAFESRLFAALGVQLASSPAITPLVRWLLLADTFAWGRTAVAVGGQPGPPGQLLADRIAFAGDCGGVITGAGVQPGLLAIPLDQPGIAFEFDNTVEIYYALNMSLIAQALEVDLNADLLDLETGVGGSGERSQLRASIIGRYVPQPVIGSGVCGTLVNLTTPVVGGVAGAPIEWRIDPALEPHGSLTKPDATTDSNGFALADYQAGEDPGEGHGTAHTDDGDVTVVIHPREILADRFAITDQRLVQLVPFDEIASRTLHINWHEPAESPSPHTSQAGSATACSGEPEPGGYTGTLTYTVRFKTGATSTTFDGSGPLGFRVAADGSVTGSWTFSEHGTSITATKSGTEQVDVTGTVTGGTISGSTAAMQLNGSMSLTEQLTVNGVSGPPSTQQVQTPIAPPLKLTADCAGNVGAAVTVATAGATLKLQAHRSS